ncbi:hypothetical protein [Amycolatopsis albispora]|uniref:ABM domain-containing protein n=1 Tax=Amycolatopsis albispora TaxID=1804986 RepID=A0A344LI51_9PSEU|nr:hypothetical protein [Amycolatopsis albispora]AXB47725.1 hypothetical protein A4R43_39115 [Amycolatopsis albispora]
MAPILMHNTMRITGDADAYRKAVADAVAFVEREGPQLMVEVFIDEAAGLAHSFQLYEDSAAILKHWELSDPYIQAVMEHCEVEELVIYGGPSDEVRAGVEGAKIVPQFAGFLR